jgi:DNA-binding LacI/PurR family transcriptional regulator
MSTIRDVARVAGVSTATVSRVINAPEAVSKATRERVRRAMQVCRYKYNALARGFVTKRSHTLGLIIPTITNPIFAESTRGAQDFANEKGYQVILANSDYEYDKEFELIDVLRERQVEGLLITTTNLGGEVLKTLLAEGFPFVLLYSTIRKGPMSAVGVDNYYGGYRATEHLVKLGHRRIAMLAGGFSFSDRSHHRWFGYKKCLAANAITYDPALVRQVPYTLAGGKEAIKVLLSVDNPPTAVFCSNDYMALGVMQGAKESGVAIPDSLSVVGFDDMAISSFISPGLTTIRQPAYEMGRLGTELLLAHIGKSVTKPTHNMMETSLIIRESTATPGNGRGKK